MDTSGYILAVFYNATVVILYFVYIKHLYLNLFNTVYKVCTTAVF